jgi:6-pyruvoyltetrahydropterin/6-carboxytetrahydropterin synthase
MILDFGKIKTTLCQWLEVNWDHRFLVWDRDPWLSALRTIDDTVVAVPFNPTAENIARHFIYAIAPTLLSGTGVMLYECVVEETRKCSAVVKFEYGEFDNYDSSK